LTITTDGTLVENVVIDGCMKVQADDVTFRNVIINCTSGAFYAANFDLGDRGVLEYSKVQMSTPGKVVRISSEDITGFGHQIRRNEIIGGEDFMWMNKNEGLVIEYNYVHDSDGDAASHSDGFQFSNENQATSFILIRGNYFDYFGTASPNETFWNHGTYDITVESNFFMPFGGRGIGRCSTLGPGRCDIKNNVYSNLFYDALATGDYQGSSIWSAVAFWANAIPNGSTYRCNRYEDGNFMEDEWISSENGTMTHDTTGCPSYP
jgi:hypothetical protein